MRAKRVQAPRIVALPPAPAAGRLSDPTLRTPGHREPNRSRPDCRNTLWTGRATRTPPRRAATLTFGGRVSHNDRNPMRRAQCRSSPRKGECMPELRKDPVTSRWVIISTERGKRPSDFGSRPRSGSGSGFCPFCPGNEDKTPPEVLAYRPDGSARQCVRTGSCGWCRTSSRRSRSRAI